MFDRAKGRLWLFAVIVLKRGRPLLGKLGSLFVVLWRHLLPLIRRCTSRSEFWWIAGITVVLLAGIILARLFWDDLRGDEESLSATVRNLGLVKGGLIAIILAVWRSVVGSRQADTAQRGLLNERYQKGAEMLGSEVLSVRLGGIYALRQLSDEHPEQYHVQIMRLFCAFARNPTEISGGGDRQIAEGKPPHAAPSLREDVQVVIEPIGGRRNSHLNIEGEVRFHLDLHGIDLRKAELGGMNFAKVAWRDWSNLSLAEMWSSSAGSTDLSGAMLCSAKLPFANLSDANLDGSCLCNAWLLSTNLSGADLADANLHGASIIGVNFSGATLSRKGDKPARGIRQSDLDFCKADPDNLPDLTGVVDADTGEPLVWTGEPLDDKSK